MARCDEGYLCQVCGKEVARLIDSSLYLQYVIGWIDPETLHTTPDSHLRCHPQLAQFIEHERFAPVKVEGDFDCRQLDDEFVADRKQLVTRGFDRLCQLQKARQELSVRDYPLGEVIAKWQ